MIVAGIQSDLVWESPAANFARLEPRIAVAAAAGADLVVLPEMFPTGFSMDAERIAEEPGGATEQWMRMQAAKHRVTLLGSVATTSEVDARPRNLALVMRPDGGVEQYAKIHPFTFAQEDRHYAAGERALVTEVAGCRVGIAICYDLRFGEMFAALADRVDLFCVIANWPAARSDHWRTLLKARSIENVCYVLGVNRVGEGGGLAYSGDSALWAPGGELVVDAEPGEDAFLVGEVDPGRVAEARAKFPVLGDRKPEVYRGF